PPDARRRTAVVTANYAQAAALDVYGPGLGVPAVYSPHRGYGYFPPPPKTADAVLYVGDDVDRIRPCFHVVRRVGRLRARSTQPASTLWYAEDRREPWSTLWPHVRHL
ncbi:MAG: hypothetical protein WCA46_18155, partial [Actinocatenispora sp.]